MFASAGAGHARRICHILASLALLAGCAPRAGWQRVMRGGCGPGSAPRVCVLAGPEAPQVLRVGGAAIVPGECAEGPGARVMVWARDGRDGREAGRKIAVRRGETAMVSAVDGAVTVHERRACEIER